MFKKIFAIISKNKINTMEWKPISEAPEHTVFLAGFESYDCGWCVDVIFKHQGDGEIHFTSGRPSNRSYTHCAKFNDGYTIPALEKE